MLLLGVLAAQAEGAVAAAGSYDLLETEILTGTQSSVTFSSLGDYSDYQHLQIRLTARMNTATTGQVSLYVQLNGDSSANYSWHYLRGTGSAVQSNGVSAQNGMVINNFAPYNNETAGNFGAAVVDLLDVYNSNKYTTIRSFCGGMTSTENAVVLNSGLWLNTASLSSIEIASLTAGRDLVAGSRLSLYGLRSA